MLRFLAFMALAVQASEVVNVQLVGHDADKARPVILQQGESFEAFKIRLSTSLSKLRGNEDSNIATIARVYDEERCEVHSLEELDAGSFLWVEPEAPVTTTTTTGSETPGETPGETPDLTVSKRVEGLVKAHYEVYSPLLLYCSSPPRPLQDFPYPHWSPAARPSCRWTSDIRTAAESAWGGRIPGEGSFRILIAGGGTGMETNGMIQELRELRELVGWRLEVVHLDLSSASLAIARQNTGSCNTTGVTVRFVQGSILDVGSLGLGEFDFIRCTGVLHHMKNPTEGLSALTSVLARHGLMQV